MHFSEDYTVYCKRKVLFKGFYAFADTKKKPLSPKLSMSNNYFLIHTYILDNTSRYIFIT